MVKQGKIHPMEYWNILDVDLTPDDILRGQGADPGSIRARRPALVQAAEQALATGKGFIHPAAVMEELAVEDHTHKSIKLENAKFLTGSLVTSHLAGAQRIVGVLCTIGEELEVKTNELFATDPLLALALDGLGNAAVEILGQQVCRRISEKAEAAGLTASTPISPGDTGWPVEIGQPQLFSLVKADRAGIRITTGGMMIPKKSISFVIGIGPDMARVEPCEVCNLKESCRYRNA